MTRVMNIVLGAGIMPQVGQLGVYHRTGDNVAGTHNTIIDSEDPLLRIAGGGASISLQSHGDIEKDLEAYSVQHRFPSHRSLTGRLTRGLDPAGVLAVSQTRSFVDTILAREAPGFTMDDLIRFTNELHFGKIWQHAGEFAKTIEERNPLLNVWLLIGHAGESHRAKGSVLNQESFMADYEKVVSIMQRAAASGDYYAAAIKTADAINKDAADVEVVDGVAQTAVDFLNIAVMGHVSGIILGNQGNLLVASGRFEYASLGLTAEEVNYAPVGRPVSRVTVYNHSSGIRIRKLGDGFAIVERVNSQEVQVGDLREDPTALGLARTLARTGRV